MTENPITPQVVPDVRSQISSPSVGLLVTGIIGAFSALADFLPLVSVWA